MVFKACAYLFRAHFEICPHVFQSSVIDNFGDPFVGSLKCAVSLSWSGHFMAVPPSVSNRTWWLGQLSPHSQPLRRSSFSQNSPSRCSSELPHPSSLSPGSG